MPALFLCLKIEKKRSAIDPSFILVYQYLESNLSGYKNYSQQLICFIRNGCIQETLVL